MMNRRRALAGLVAAVWAGGAQANVASSLFPVARPGTLPVERDTPEQIVANAALGGVSAVAMAPIGGLAEALVNADVPLPPASVAKALTALYALDALGVSHRFTTHVEAVGPVTDGVLEGDLILRGTGDPTLSTDRLGDLAEAVAATGLREVRGRFLVDASALPSLPLIDPEQPEQVGYNPGVSGLNLNFNRVHFEWRRAGEGYTILMDARGDRYRPQVAHSVMRPVGRGAPVYARQSLPGREVWTVARGALGDAGSRWLPVRMPELYTADVFRTLLAMQGVAVPPAVQGRAEGPVREVARDTAEPLSEIVRDMLRFSTNVTAEALGLAATAARGQAPESLLASARAMSVWLNETYGAATAMVDHSGLGVASRVTAEGLVAVMEGARDGPLRGLLRRHTIRDESYAVIQNPSVTVDAKTGTLNFVSTLAGYHVGRDGVDRAFAVLSTDLERRAALSRSERERPAGGREWGRAARKLQQRFLREWGTPGIDAEES
ncbi:MAG: D-alanyl-D-alanine carboxypeptidase/D-alanyl-D-alanine endopeptidase [Shimia sp.]